jgi:acyl-CoA reductase-like NAD-dependent aldehyde dehydrogenase
MGIQQTVDGLGHLIDGELVTTGDTFPVDNPSTGEIIAQCPAATVELVDRAMAAAAAALPKWSATPEEERREVIRQMCAAIEGGYQQIDELASAEKGQAGSGGEAWFSTVFGKHIADQHIPVDILEDDENRTVKVVRTPVGVVAAIAPWNAPVLILAEKIFMALLVGDTVVAKPSPFTPLGTLMVAKLWKDIVPPGVVNILAGDDAVGEAMVTHPTTRMVSFTGSVAAGKKIAAAAAPTLKNVLMELGGNDAAIVLEDVDVKKVAPMLYGSAFGGVGQICAATKRVYVHESIYDSMVDELAALASVQVAAPADAGGTMGPLSTKPQYERVKMLVEDALEHGGKAVTGGEPAGGPGYFYPATILTGVGEGVRVVDEEQFGPVLPVIPFSDVDWAIDQANATEYGLCGSVWTKDIEQGERLAARLECGTSWVNQHTEVAPHIPFGGVKSSGIGRNNGQPGTDAYSELKTIIVYKDKDRV